MSMDSGEDLLDLVCHSKEADPEDADDDDDDVELYNYCAHNPSAPALAD